MALRDTGALAILVETSFAEATGPPCLLALTTFSSETVSIPSRAFALCLPDRAGVEHPITAYGVAQVAGVISGAELSGRDDPVGPHVTAYRVQLLISMVVMHLQPERAACCGPFTLFNSMFGNRWMAGGGGG